MKNYNLTYTAEGEVTKIELTLRDADITVNSTRCTDFTVKCENGKGAAISLDENILRLDYTPKKRIFSRRKNKIEISVPEHTVAAIDIKCENCAVMVLGGIYDKFTLDGDCCGCDFEGASFSQCSLSGAKLSTKLKNVTVKNALIVKCDEGDMLWENSFAACTECRVKRGNIGLCGFNCKDSILEAENGNVAARLDGDESDYNLGLLIKEGTANRESVLREGAARTFKAYSAKGNIAIDFTAEEYKNTYGDS